MKKMIPVTTYAELEAYAADFADGSFNLLFIISMPGLGKSQTFAAATAGRRDCHRLDGHFTPLAFYVDLFNNINKNVWLDDVDGLYDDRKKVMMLKALCQTDPVKTMRWESSRPPEIDGLQVPSFQTRSKVAIIMNSWKTLNANVGALENRGIAIRFVPSPEEVHRKVGEWMRDREVYDFIGELVPGLTRNDMRAYVHAAELKYAGKDWRALVPMLLDLPEGSDAEIAARLHADETMTNQEKEAEYARQARSKSRASYYRNVKRALALPHDEPVRH